MSAEDKKPSRRAEYMGVDAFVRKLRRALIEAVTMLKHATPRSPALELSTRPASVGVTHGELELTQ